MKKANFPLLGFATILCLSSLPAKANMQSTGPQDVEASAHLVPLKTHNISIGGASISLNGASASGLVLSYAAFASVRDFDIKTVINLAVPALFSSYFFTWSLGANYHLSTANTAPYVGADLGWSSSTINSGTSVSGLGVGGVAGVEFFRYQKVGINLEARVDTILFGNSIPFAASVRFGILF